MNGSLGRTNTKEVDELLDDDYGSPQATLLLPLARDETQSEARPLAYLDGLRGIAALMVYLHHHVTEYYGDNSDLTHAYGYKDSDRIAALPFLRIFFNGGAPAVMIFFVLSGYVLSRSSLRMLRDGQSPNKQLLSAVIRRPFRLFLPPILVSLPLLFIYHSPFAPLGGPKPETSLFSEMPHFVMELLRSFNPFIGHGPFLQSFAYNPPIWTMPYEFNGSMLVFGAIYAFQRLDVKSRILAFFLTGVGLFYVTHWSATCFMAGVIIAQIDLLALDQKHLKRLTARTRLIMFNIFFVLAWFWLSQVAANLVLKKPVAEGTNDSTESTEFTRREDDTTPADDTPKLPVKVDIISMLLPFPFNYHHWLFANMIGAILLVYTILRLPWLQHALGGIKFFKFLGKVSFALYLTHVPFLWLVAIPLARILGQIPEKAEPFMFDGVATVPDVGMMGLTTRYLAMQALVLPLNLVLASFVTTTIDERSVAISKKVSVKVLKMLGY